MAYGWHCLRANGRLGFKDRRLVEVGQRMEMRHRRYEGEPTICYCGMHASPTITAARGACLYPSERLLYNTAWLCRVRVGGDMRHSHTGPNPKMVGRYRTVIYRVRWGAVKAALVKLYGRSLGSFYEAQYLAAVKLARKA